MIHPKYSLLAQASLLAGMCFASAGRAETKAELERADALFQEGRALSASGNYDAACAKFEASLAVVEGLGTRFNLADCEEKRRHYARAQTLFLRVAEQSHESGQLERERVARERALALDSKLSRLTVELQVPAVEFELDGQPVAHEALSNPVAIEPGKHRISARRPGKAPWSSEITVPRSGLFVIVKVPRLEDAPGAATTENDAAPVSAVPVEPLTRSAPLPASVQSGTSVESAVAARRVALVLGGVGVGALLAGSTFGLQYLASDHDAKSLCPSSQHCSAEDISAHQSLLEDTRRQRTWAYVGLTTGGVALAGAAIAYFGFGRHAPVTATTGFNRDGSWNVRVLGKF